MIDPARLKGTLLKSGLQYKDNILYQVILQMIELLTALKDSITSGGGSSTTTNITNVSNVTQFLSTFDEGGSDGGDSSIVQVIQGSAVDREWSVLTNGDVTSPELIFAGGDVIMTHIP